MTSNSILVWAWLLRHSSRLSPQELLDPVLGDLAQPVPHRHVGHVLMSPAGVLPGYPLKSVATVLQLLKEFFVQLDPGAARRYRHTVMPWFGHFLPFCLPCNGGSQFELSHNARH